jgi:hypothetical protein
VQHRRRNNIAGGRWLAVGSIARAATGPPCCGAAEAPWTYFASLRKALLRATPHTSKKAKNAPPPNAARCAALSLGALNLFGEVGNRPHGDGRTRSGPCRSQPTQAQRRLDGRRTRSMEVAGDLDRR